MKLLIIEDEEIAASRLQKMILDIDPNFEIIGILDSIESSIIWLENNPEPDIIIMDIHLADGSSFEIFSHVEIQCPVIFQTAYDEYAVQAFRVNALDYLLKPVKKEELKGALEKFKKQKLKSPNTATVKKIGLEGGYSKRLLLRIGQNIHVIDINEAAYYYTENKMTFLITNKGKRYPLDFSLEKVSDMLNPNQFFRINRQFIINLKAIKDMYAYSKSRVKVHLQPPCDLDTIVSTERSSKFKKWLVGED